MIRHFCTYFDQRYLSRGLALHESLRRHCPDFRLWVLCLDDVSLGALAALALPDIVPISLDDFERNDGALRLAKLNRSAIEYYFTCTPSLPLFLLRQDPDIDMVTYIDADVYFFGSPEPLFEEMGDASIGIIPHRFSQATRHWEKCGIYNVGWLTFRRDDAGLACLRWWRESCLEWCYDREEEGRFADQKYLDDWPSRFAGVHVIGHEGANVASWNLANHTIANTSTGLRVGPWSLIFFHFHHLKQRTRWLFETDVAAHGATIGPVAKKHIYAPYLRMITEMDRVIAQRADTPLLHESAPIRNSLTAVSGIHPIQTISDLLASRALLYVSGRIY